MARLDERPERFQMRTYSDEGLSARSAVQSNPSPPERCGSTLRRASGTVAQATKFAIGGERRPYADLPARYLSHTVRCRQIGLRCLRRSVPQHAGHIAQPTDSSSSENV